MIGLRLVLLAAGFGLGLQGATQLFAWTYRWDEALGPCLRLHRDLALYWPWSILEWRQAYAQTAGPALSRSLLPILVGAVAGQAAGALVSRGSPARIRGWGSLRDARAAGLLAAEGAVIGVFEGRVLASLDLRPSLVTGGTRSGKGRGHVTPSLLSWPGSVLVHDPKSELWDLTAGWRSRFSHAAYLDPRDPDSVRWNPLAEIRPGPAELAQVQRLVAILSDPGGARDDDSIWDRAASEIVEAVILHVLYTVPDREKTLVKVRELLAELDRTAETMGRTLHRLGPDGEPETHPFILGAVKGYVSMHDRFRTSVQGTARAYLKWLAGEDVERVLSTSDFAMGDLMCAPAPVSLYVQFSPADSAALRPLVRLLFYAAAQSLTVEADRDAAGRPKRHKLLMVMDEFPLLGRLSFFEKSLRLMSGYGIKPMLVAQSLNDIVETYGAHNTILDNCGVYTAFSALDPLTQEKVSRLTGSVAELRTSRSAPAGLGPGRVTVSQSQSDRPLLEPGEIRALPDAEQLVFAAGRRPLRTRKLLYDRREPYRSRAALPPPDQSTGPDLPAAPPHPWAGRSSLGEAPGQAAAIAGAAPFQPGGPEAPATDPWAQFARDLAAQPAAFNPLERPGHAKD